LAQQLCELETIVTHQGNQKLLQDVVERYVERSLRGATHNFREFARNNMNTYLYILILISPNFHRHILSSHLGLVYNDPSVFAIFGSAH
jgi:ribosomal protein L17